MAKKNPVSPRLRHIYLNRERNGFAIAFHKLGSLILIDEQKFWECVLQNRGKRLDGGQREQVLQDASGKAKARKARP